MDPERIGRLIDQHAGALELYARQWCDVADDVVQEAFVKLSGQRPWPDNPASWLFRVVRHAAINAGVAERRRKRHETAAAVGSAGWFEFKDGTAGEVDPESAEAALRALPADQREVVVAHLWGGLTFEQVAGVVGCSSSTAHRVYQAALAALRVKLGVSCPRPSSIPSPTRG